jgi:predicted dehydrogenase
MTGSHHEVIIVGLGAVSQTHLKVLERTPGTDVTAAVDTADKPGMTFRGHPLPVYRTLQDASRHHKADVVVIATPTPAHAGVCAQAARCFPTARILVEKPAADNLPDAQHVLADIGTHQPVDVAYHMAFSPEVTWGAQTAQANAADLGVPTAIEATFTDPYTDNASAISTLANSWIDSGINSLSILNRFAKPVSRSSLRRIGEPEHSVFEAHIICLAAGAEIDARILTSWHVTDPAKTTRIRYSSGAELVMDHTAVAGYLVKHRQIAAVCGSDRTIPRRERHYLALYKWWLEEGNRILPAQTSLHLHNLLLQPSGDA